MSDGRWSWLSSLPSTNAMLTTVMLLWLATGLGAIVKRPAADRWFQALETYTGIVVIQFIGKRWTNGRGTNGNGNGHGDKPVTP